jgi:hypothetical protein
MCYINTLLLTLGSILGLPIAVVFALTQYFALIVIVLKIFRYNRQED